MKFIKCFVESEIRIRNNKIVLEEDVNDQGVVLTYADVLSYVKSEQWIVDEQSSLGPTTPFQQLC